MNVVWDTAYATNAVFYVATSQGNVLLASFDARGARSVTIPCNGTQQQLIVTPYRANGNNPIHGADAHLVVNEGIEGT